MPAAVRRSFQERAERALRRECSSMLEGEPAAPRAELQSARARFEGWHVATCCSGKWVAGILYPHRVGIALVRVSNRGQDEVRATTSHDELELLGGFRWRHFARISSAKRAVLAMAGASVEELGECRLVVAPVPCGMVLVHRGRAHHVHQIYHHGHFASLCADRADRAEIRWDWKDSPALGDATQ
jgi:hypothetical protein